MSATFFVAIMSDSLMMHLETLNFFSFQYLEAAVKEGMTPMLERKAVRRRDKERRAEAIRQAREKLLEESQNDANKNVAVVTQKKKRCAGCRKACGLLKSIFKAMTSSPWKQKRRKKKKKGEEDPKEEEQLVDREEPVFCDWWTDGIGIEKLQLELLKQVKAPVKMFFDDQKKAEEPKNPFLPAIMGLHPGTGLSDKTTHPEFRSAHSAKRELRAQQREDEHGAAKKKNTKKNQFDDLFGAEEVVMEFNTDLPEIKDEDEEEGGPNDVLMMWDAPDWLVKVEVEEDHAGQRPKRQETAHDRVKAAAQRFDERFWSQIPDARADMEGPPELVALEVDDPEPDAFWTAADLNRFPEKEVEDKSKGKKKK